MTDKVLKFQATWCGPCKALSMALKDVDLGVPVEEVDIDQNRERAMEFNIRSVPTLVYVRDDKALSSLMGLQPVTKVQEWVNSNK